MRPIDADELLSLYEGEDENLRVSLRVVKENIKDMPTIEVEPFMYDTGSWQTTVTDTPPVEYAPIRHGWWVNHISENGATDGIYCGICDYEISRDARYKFCPNCGARMDGEEND